MECAILLAVWIMGSVILEALEAWRPLRPGGLGGLEALEAWRPWRPRGLGGLEALEA